jgi:hypothetical protein
MIKKIKDILKPPKTAHNPYGLKDGQIAQLKTLIARSEWKEFQSLLDLLCTFLAEGLLLELDERVIHQTRGYILGLRRAGTLVDEISTALEATDARERRDSIAEQRARERQQLAAYGTDFWRTYLGS